MSVSTKKQKIIKEVECVLKDHYKYELQGIMPQGDTAEIVRFWRAHSFPVEMPKPLKIHWWDRYLVPTSVVRSVLISYNYVDELNKYLLASHNLYFLYDQLEAK